MASDRSFCRSSADQEPGGRSPRAFVTSNRGHENSFGEYQTIGQYFKTVSPLKKKNVLEMKDRRLRGVSAGWSWCVAVCRLWSFPWGGFWCQSWFCSGGGTDSRLSSHLSEVWRGTLGWFWCLQSSRSWPTPHPDRIPATLLPATDNYQHILDIDVIYWQKRKANNQHARLPANVQGWNYS